MSDPCLLSCHLVPSKEKEDLLIKEHTKISWSEATHKDIEKVTQSEGAQQSLSRNPALKCNSCSCTQEEMVEVDIDLVSKKSSSSCLRGGKARVRRDSLASSRTRQGRNRKDKRGRKYLVPNLNIVWDRQQVLIHEQGEHITTWLLQYWEGREAQQLGSITRDYGSDKGIRRETAHLWASGRGSYQVWRQGISSKKAL